MTLCISLLTYSLFFFNDTATTEIYTLSLHDALPILSRLRRNAGKRSGRRGAPWYLAAAQILPDHAPGSQGIKTRARSEEHTSALQSQSNLVCRLLLEKKKKRTKKPI